mmetsp:Transcript_40256/g.71904  ORF Transcript_40256/g.71904 Transcript_40256/m.71904 type:complete len:214 (-) Transcript_40256:1146-1787(-)
MAVWAFLSVRSLSCSSTKAADTSSSRRHLASANSCVWASSDLFRSCWCCRAASFCRASSSCICRISFWDCRSSQRNSRSSFLSVSCTTSEVSVAICFSKVPALLERSRAFFSAACSFASLRSMSAFSFALLSTASRSCLCSEFMMGAFSWQSGQASLSKGFPRFRNPYSASSDSDSLSRLQQKEPLRRGPNRWFGWFDRCRPVPRGVGSRPSD